MALPPRLTVVSLARGLLVSLSLALVSALDLAFVGARRTPSSE